MGTMLAIGGAFLSGGLSIIAIYEAYALATGRVPAITDIVRNKISEKPHEAVACFTFFGMLAGWLLGHLGR